jgi:hypothetical protein
VLIGMTAMALRITVVRACVKAEDVLRVIMIANAVRGKCVAVFIVIVKATVLNRV